LIANVGTTFSATSLAKVLKNEQRPVAPEIILNYIKSSRFTCSILENIVYFPKYVVSLDEFSSHLCP